VALLERTPAVATDAEALFKEARRRRRRRWVVGSCLALVAASVVVAVGRSSTAPDRPARPPAKTHARKPGPQPVVNVRAFSGQGQLAFVSRTTLWVLDGATHALHRVVLPKGLVPIAPTFSPDRRWLAFVTGTTSVHGSLWIARADGSRPHRVTGIVDGDAFGWSPRSDLYAVAAGPVSTRVPFGQPTTVRLVSPNGSARTIATAPAIVGAAWAPDGASLAVSTMGHDFVPSLDSYSVVSDQRTVWTGAPDSAHEDFVVPAGWWAGWGVVYTVIGNGAVPDGEGSFEDAPLYSLAAPDATPHLLGETLTDDSDGPPSASKSGLLTFVSDTGQDPRTPWDGKQVQVCAPAPLSCAPAPAPAGDVTEDPVWSPSGSMLAYVAAPSNNGSDEYLPAVVSSWYGAHLLELYDPATRSASQVTGAPGATAPSWSGNGQSLLYVASDGLWLLPTATALPVEVSSPLFAPPNPASYYGAIDWQQQFGWSRGAPLTQCYVACNPA